MTGTVAWSPNLRLEVKKCKEMKAITHDGNFRVQAVTTVEEQAIQKQLLQKSEDGSVLGGWA